MMLRTSSSSINPALNMFLFTVRKNIGLLVMSVVAVLMLCPGFYLVRLEDYESYSIDLVWVLAALLTVGASILTVLYNVLNFLFLYSKKASDVFHSIPLTRSELLLSRWGAGIVLTLIPVLVGYLALIGIFIFIPELKGDIGAVLGSFSYTVMTVLVCSTLSMIFIVCAGSAFDLILSFFGVNLGLLAVGLVFGNLMDELLVGAYNSVNSGIFEILSPIWYCGAGLVRFIDASAEFEPSQIWFFVRTGAYVVAFLVLSLILYKRRKAEKAGDAYAYRAVYLICSFVVGIPVSYLIGYIFVYDEYSNPLFWVFAFLGALLFAVAFGAITDRGFKTFKRSLIVGACSVATLGAVALIFSSGAFGYSTRVPSKSVIKTVTVDYSSESIDYEDVELPLSVHKKLVENIDKISNSYSNEVEAHSLGITYTLKNGSTIKRRYLVPVKDFGAELFSIYSSDERLEMIESVFERYEPRSVNVSGSRIVLDKNFNGDEDEYENMWINVYIKPSEYRQVLDAYKKDIKLADKSIISREETNTVYFDWESSIEEYKYASYNFDLDESFANTVSVLQSLELPERQFEEEKWFKD